MMVLSHNSVLRILIGFNLDNVSLISHNYFPCTIYADVIFTRYLFIFTLSTKINFLNHCLIFCSFPMDPSHKMYKYLSIISFYFSSYLEFSPSILHVCVMMLLHDADDWICLLQ